MPRGTAQTGTVIGLISRAIAAVDEGDFEADKPSPRDPPSDPRATNTCKGDTKPYPVTTARAT